MDFVKFKINGKEYKVKPDCDNIGTETYLVDYIRDCAGLKGTKYFCREGGCGICSVSVKTENPLTGEAEWQTLNSCLIPVFACDGWEISTIESLGNRKDGYSEVQKRLVKYGGTQCGYCTPGFLMGMNSLLKSNKELTAKQIEDSFDGTICRCTAYRPIFDAFKTFAVDGGSETRQRSVDIEDCHSCPMMNQKQNASCASERASQCNELSLQTKSGSKYMKVCSLRNAFETIAKFQQANLKFRLLAGNTSIGIYKDDGPYDAYLDISNVMELKMTSSSETEVVIGGGCTETNIIARLQAASTMNGFSYLKQISEHLKKVDNLQTRNLATIGGNLMLKHTHRELVSDSFVIMEAVAAEIVIASSPDTFNSMSFTEFLQQNMNGKIIYAIKFKSYSDNYIYRTFRVSKRYESCISIVNAGILMKVDKANGYFVGEKPRIVFGGINPSFTHASSTESFLTGKSLRDSLTVKLSMEVLGIEVDPDNRPPDCTPRYRKALAQSLLYKYILGVLGKDAKSEYQSGGTEIERPVKTGKQSFQTYEDTAPVGQPIEKLEGFDQCSGEAEYVNDIHPKHGELHAAFVTSSAANAEILNIDASDALSMEGVVAFVSAKDIPGENNYFVFNIQPLGLLPEEIFASKLVKYVGQPVGLIVARDRPTAFRAVKLVKITYINLFPPVIGIQEKVRAEKAKYEQKAKENPSKAGNIIIGEFKILHQYHFQMENQITKCVLKDGNSMDVYSATQWIDQAQHAVASALNTEDHKINVSVRRLGGAFGSKQTRAAWTSTACAVASYVTNKPVTLEMDLQSNMEIIGKRTPYYIVYQATVDNDGKIIELLADLICDTGMERNEEISELGLQFIQSCYSAKGWLVIPLNFQTNTPSNTVARAPGGFGGIMSIENIMDHIAFSIKKDPTEVRLANRLETGDAIYFPISAPSPIFEDENLFPKMLKELTMSAQLASRKQFIENFNKKSENRWKKRGLAVIPMRYNVYYEYSQFQCFIAVYHADGSVAVSHAGIEKGQGINTKVAQAVALALGISLDLVSVKASNNLVCPNNERTFRSITSELCVYAALIACRKLLYRLLPIKEDMVVYSWKEMIRKGYEAHIDLTASHVVSKNDGLKPYSAFGICATEVEIDCLTGEYRIVRSDVLEDVGNSLNQQVDITQVEGSFLMGVGLNSTERIVYDKITGRLLTNGTYTYQPPMGRDIPDDFRVSLLKNTPNPKGVLGSKGEPAVTLGVSFLLAVKNALYAARSDAGNVEWFELSSPVSVEDIRLHSLTEPTQFDI